MEARKRGATHWNPLDVTWDEAGARVSLEGRDWLATAVTYPNGEHAAHSTLAALARDLAEAGYETRACLSCERFRFSGMTLQMSGGHAGYCSRVGFRNTRGVVGIEHLCGEHAPDPLWPLDESAAFEARTHRPPRDARESAFEGCLLGLAVGDALGFPSEFRRREQILEAFGPRGLTDFVALHDPRWPARPAIMGRAHPPGTYSDDTQMTLAVAEALLAEESGDLDALMKAMAERFIAWSRSPTNNRGPGNACMTGSQHLARGIPWREAGVADSKGCGSAMRVAPIGLRFWRDHERLLETARAQSLLTHRHDAGIEGAAAAALLVALALEKRSPEAMYEAVMEECAPRSRDFAACLGKLPSLIAEPPEKVLTAEGLGEGWVAEEAVASALYCFWRSPVDFETTVLAAANTDGDSDSIACIAGGISGAFNGSAAIRPDWVERLEDAPAIRGLALRLEQRSR